MGLLVVIPIDEDDDGRPVPRLLELPVQGIPEVALVLGRGR